jgi:hypothetical protein
MSDEERKKLMDHPAYQLGVQHAQAGIAPNSFADKPDVTDLNSATAAAGGAPAVAAAVPPPIPRPRPVSTGVDALRTATPASKSFTSAFPAVATTPTAQQAPATLPTTPAAQTPTEAAAVDEKTRRSKGVSVADWDQRPGGSNDPWSNGFFNRRPVIPTVSTPTPTAPVGATQAATIDTSSGLRGNTRTPAVKPVVPTAAPLRQPVIAGLSGENQAADYVAGGRFSSAKAGPDPTLDPDYVANLPRPRRRNQFAVASSAPSRLFYPR